MSDKRLYVYKIVVDNGGAPCVHDSLLSLAICKPAIRRTAQCGDLIFAFGTNSETPANRLVYVARVTDRVTDGQYYALQEYRHRPDCIYEHRSGGRLLLSANARYHNQVDLRPRDVGQYPEYLNAVVLISSDFRYFGGSGTDNWKQACRNLANLVENMSQGHRVEHPAIIYEELLALKRAIWRRHRSKCIGAPLHTDDADAIDDDDTFETTSTACHYMNRVTC